MFPLRRKTASRDTEGLYESYTRGNEQDAQRSCRMLYCPAAYPFEMRARTIFRMASST